MYNHNGFKDLLRIGDIDTKLIYSIKQNRNHIHLSICYNIKFCIAFKTVYKPKANNFMWAHNFYFLQSLCMPEECFFEFTDISIVKA